MNSLERPTFFYLFPKGNDLEILPLTDVEADKLWRQGRRWRDIPQKTLSEAKQLRLQLLAGDSSAQR